MRGCVLREKKALVCSLRLINSITMVGSTLELRRDSRRGLLRDHCKAVIEMENRLRDGSTVIFEQGSIA